MVCWSTEVCHHYCLRRHRQEVGSEEDDIIACWCAGVCYQHYHRLRRPRQEVGSEQDEIFVCWRTGVRYQHYHRRHRQEVGSEQDNIKCLSVGIQECVINIIIVVVVVVVVVVRRWGLNRKTTLFSVGVQECVINFIIAVVPIVTREGLNRRTLKLYLLEYRRVLLSSPSSSSSRGGV